MAVSITASSSFQFAPKICVPGSSPNREELEEQSEHVEMLSPLLPGHPDFPCFLPRAEGRVAGGGCPNAALHSAERLKGDLLARPCQADNWTTGFLQRIGYRIPTALPPKPSLCSLFSSNLEI